MSAAKFYNLHKHAESGQSILLGQFAISVDPAGRIEQMQFRYHADYLALADGDHRDGSISPLLPEVDDQVYSFDSDGRSFVGFIDDLLPDDWGKKVIARRLGKRFITDLMALDFIGRGASIGAVKITPVNHEANWGLGLRLNRVEHIIDALFNGQLDQLSQQEQEAALLVQGGSQVGGARPKILVLDDQNIPHVIKPNQRQDAFDYAALEWASLEICRLSGIPTAEASLYELNGIRSLLIKRFDVTESGGRLHMVSVNSLLKDPASQMDAMQYSYEDIADCIRKYSCCPREDLQQLFAQMLINQVLSNSDDHLRNFSMMQTEQGWQLAPVYDVVPQQFYPAEHACMFNGSGYLPKLVDAELSGKRLGLSKKDILDVKERVENALSHWRMLLKEKGISDERALRLTEITQQ